MKLSTILFFVLIIGLLFVLWNRESAKVALRSDGLYFFTKGCEYVLPVERLQHESEHIDALSIVRELLELPNGDHIYYERIDLPATYSFDTTYEELLAALFSMPFDELYSKNGFVLYQGEFSVALFYRSGHDLVLIYPADDLVDLLLGCFEEKVQRGLLKKGKKLVKTHWNFKQILLDNLINKDY